MITSHKHAHGFSSIRRAAGLNLGQHRSRAILLIALAFAVVFPLGLVAARALLNESAPPVSPVAGSEPRPGWRVERGASKQATTTRAAETFGRLPLSFEANQGQLDQAVNFAARGPGYQIALTANGAWLRLRKTADRAPESGLRSSHSALVRMRLAGANPAPKAIGLEELPGKVNYFIGKDPKKWRQGIATYAKVKYREVYPGVDLVYYGNQRQLEYDLVVAPGADPQVIHLAFDGVGRMSVDGQGELVMPTRGGELRQRKPYTYQETATGRKEVASRFVLTGERELRFEIGPHDRNLQLVIDPALVYSTYLGGSFSDYPGGIAVDSAGAAYVTGESESFDFPGITPINGNRGVYKSTNGGGNWNGSGTGLIRPFVNALAIDPATPATLYAGTYDGVFKSANSGGSWSASNNGLPDFAFINDIVISPVNPSILYAAVSGFPDNGVFKSANGGGSWSAVNTGLPADRFVHDLAINPADPSTVYAVVFDSSIELDKVYKTTNGGGSWNLASTGLGDFVGCLAVDPVTTSTLYVSTSAGVFKSTNSGDAWSLSNTGLTGFVIDFAINPASPSTVYGACTDGIFKSANGGGSWGPVNAGLPANARATVLAIDPVNPSTLYASIYDNTTFRGIGLFKTTNGGGGWSLSSSGVLSNSIQALAVNPVNPAIVYAGADAGRFAFAAKLNPAGSALLYSTYLGGDGYSSSSDIAVDSNGNAYLTGGAASFDFPTTPGAYFTGTGFGGTFATKLNAGGAIAYSTLIPEGNGFVGSFAIATDSAGRMYIAGNTNATDFPVTSGAAQTTAGGGVCPPFNDPCADGFFMKINPAGGGASDLQYATYLGGSQGEDASQIAVDGLGRVYIVGYTNSTNFPTTSGAYQTTWGGGICPENVCFDAFVSRINPVGGGASDLQYSTYLGGSGHDFGYGIAVDGLGKIYVSGYTEAANFPTTPNAYQTACAGPSCSEAFVAKLDPAAAGVASLLYSTYFGGSGNEYGAGIAVDSASNAYVTGGTGSTDLPVTPGAPQPAPGGGSCGALTCYDAFVARFNPSLSGVASLIYSTYLGGSDSDYGSDIAADAAGNAYVIGWTSATNFPTVNPIQTNQPVDDVFVTKICPGPDLAIAKSHPGNFTIGSTGNYSIVVSNAALICTTTGAITVTDPLPANLTLQGFGGTGWSCTGTGTANVICTHAGPVAAGGSLPMLTLTVNVGAGTPGSITNTATVSTPGEGNTANNSASDPTVVSCPAITVSPTDPNLTPGRAGDPYSQTFTAAGGNGSYSFSLSVGALPPGLSLASGGALAGTPAGFGTFNFTVRATDSNNCFGERAYTLVVNPPCGTIAVNPATLPNGFQAAAYNQTVTATGGTAPYNFTVSAGALPGGLSLSSAGAITGTPTAPGAFSFTVKATDNNGCMGARAYTVVISGAGLMYYPLPRPVRLLDTRPGFAACFAPGAPLGNNAVRLQPASGACTGVPANAKAIAGNATVVNSPTISTDFHWITLFPSDALLPDASNLNFTDDQIVPNNFTVGLGADGAFNIYSHAATHFIVDIAGYYAPPGVGGLYYHPLPAPVRLLDTRPGFGACNAPGAPLVAEGVRSLTAHGSCFGATIPSTARSVVGNATVVNSGPTLSTGFHWITLYPFDAPLPDASNLNYREDQIVPNAFVAGLSPDGKFNIYSHGATHFIVDVAGYFSAEAVDANGVGLLYNPLPAPVRLLDTRPGFNACDAPATPLGTDAIRVETATVACSGIPSGAKAVVGNATVVNVPSLSSGFHWITLYPFGASLPDASNLNYRESQITPNAFVVGLSADGKFNTYSHAPTHFIIDLTGYFAP
jgi:uncharacterized repeat protein (TIGR01451 family)